MNAAGSKYEFLRLRLEGLGLSDQVVVRFMPNADVGLDNNDAFKFDNAGFVPNISSLADTFDMAINSLPEGNKNFTVQIRTTVKFTNDYKIIAEDIKLQNVNSCVILEDILTNTFINLKTDSSYSFNISDTTVKPRFKLHILAMGFIIYQYLTVYAVVSPILSKLISRIHYL